jgi:hypothetical protein
MKTTNVLLSVICVLLALIVVKLYQPQPDSEIAGSTIPAVKASSMVPTGVVLTNPKDNGAIQYKKHKLGLDEITALPVYVVNK